MSESDVVEVFGPRWAQYERDRRRITEIERVVVALRRKLRALDPSLPHEFDGQEWAQLEAEFLS